MHRPKLLLRSVPFLMLLSASAVQAQVASGFRLNATYDRPGLPVPHWQLRIAPTGQAEYTSEHAAGAPPAAATPITFKLSQAGSAKLMKFLSDSHGMQPCETKTKGLARMGMKTLEFQEGTHAAASCTFNYTDNKPLAAATEYLLAVSYTIEQGATLDHLHRYDRLGLDPVMTQLATAFKNGQAQEVQAIRPTLASLANDDAVLERVRQKAAELLVAADRP
ncbi:hypothetical protein [Terriglobus aquaticus]|uniref:Uncharacterized protein n=1 Tax=Terriglobus aquaticus TaxID=940139 RepID=A0ABW9KNT3_9BACT|nr:hypothetical protein [Terriglobus aquaticus]